MDNLFHRSSEGGVFTPLAPQDFFLDHRQDNGMEVIVVHIFSQLVTCRPVDFIGVHDSGDDILSTELIFQKAHRLGVELPGVVIAAFSLKVHRVHINDNLVKKGSVLPQPPQADCTVPFHLPQDFHIGLPAGVTKMNIEGYPLRYDIDVVVAFVLPLIVPFCRPNV